MSDRTPGGSPTADTRDKYGYNGTGRFPIWDKESAINALRLRGHAKDEPALYAWILRTAAKYAPEAAAKAREEDKKKPQ